MAYQVLARKYRPQLFADVAGQDHVTVTLMNALRQNRIAHGYIFSGHRGIGKTTIARILACALNCRNLIGSPLRPTPEPCLVCESCTEIRAGNSVDVLEIDAATNRGIDDIRELRDAARYRPSRDKYKIYILDEAHQITDAAFNALLKTLEEPPDHIVFMMATTQPEDIPQTVRSRCQHFSFHAVKLADILTELRGIAEHEGVDADESSLAMLAEAGDGSMRDALSIMDQAIASAPTEEGKPRLEVSQIRELMGTVPNTVFERILQAVDQNRAAEVITSANDLLDAGNSPAQLARQAVRYLRSCLLAKIAGLNPDAEPGTEHSTTELLQISPEEQRRAARTAALFSEEELTRFLQTMLRTFDELGYRQEQRFHFELGLLKLVHLRRLLPIEEILSGMSTGSAKSAAPQPRIPAGAPSPVVLPRPATITAAPSKAAFSPFEQDRNRRKYDGIPSSTSVSPAAVPELPVQAVPVQAVPVQTAPIRATPFETSSTVLLSERAPEPLPIAPTPPASAAPELIIAEPAQEPPTRTPEPANSADAHTNSSTVQKAAVDALQSARQSSAADALDDAAWTLLDGEARVQTELSPTMLPAVLNPEAEKIVRTVLRSLGILKLALLPGASTLKAIQKKPRTVRSGSAQAKAREHPIVQQAQKLFNAEIQTVIDLSGSD